MAFTLTDDGEDSSSVSPPENGDTFRVSARPLIVGDESKASHSSGASLPISYGTQTLHLMARDPRTLFAHWDLDWQATFGDQPPANQKVHLRVRPVATSEEISVEVEPMAGSCYVEVPEGGAAYVGEIGYFEPAGKWHSVAKSSVATTPRDTVSAADRPDFATVPFHLTFQRMIEALRVARDENESLTGMLQDLRERVAPNESGSAAEPTAQEREILRAADKGASQEPTPGRDSAEGVDLWAATKLEGMLSFGNSSPGRGFGGSSRSV